MAQFRNLLKRCIPLLLVLVVVISLFPAVPALAAEASSSEGDLSSVGPDISSADAAVLSTYTLSGVWVIKSSPFITSTIQQTVNFVSNGVSYSAFQVWKSSVSVSFGIRYGPISNRIDVYEVGDWVSSAYKTVDFGTTAQTVSSDFYSWFTANATKQATSYTYTAKLDGSSILTYTTTATSVQLNVEIFNESAYFYFESDYDDGFDKGYSNDDNQRFCGLSRYSSTYAPDFSPGAHGPTYSIDLSSTSNTINLYSVYEYSLTIDPNGGTWNGSSSPSVFWDQGGNSSGDILVPERTGYRFSGWTVTGEGELNVEDGSTYFDYGYGPATLTATWSEIVLTTYTHTISISGDSFVFSCQNLAPAVTIDVTSSGITISDSISTQTWSYSGSDNFLGVQDAAGNEYLVGSSFSISALTGSDKTSVLTPLTETPSQNTYNTLVKLYDSSGNSLLKSFLASSDAASPSATLAIGEKQLVFDSSALDSAITWNYTGDGIILGIALSANATSPSYTPGQIMDFSGVSGQGSVTSIYLITDSSSAPDPDPGTGPFETIVVLGGIIYEFVSNEAYPVVKISIFADKVDLSDGVTSYEWRPADGVKFLGFSLKPNDSEPSYRVSDEWWIVQGSANKDIFQYYPFYVGSGDPQYTDAQRVFAGMANFLIGPLMIFFSVEFIPGLSFGAICLLAFCIGLVFWLLKSSK